MKIRDWFKVASIAVFLVVVPSSLAMVTAYQTPAIGGLEGSDCIGVLEL
jgi:hypothetical protein